MTGQPARTMAVRRRSQLVGVGASSMTSVAGPLRSAASGTPTYRIGAEGVCTGDD